ncbi:uncharacterized protein LOC122531132 [Frieseomelitta varia]|uniref:uncharacterized protein LOC122531132 n=1 Tax=Frieseomelitta varia TaxID=561572 RepID=UPI001CB68FCE|nr:uncharacterized protein LOC122531132 [Frieseomelitta varia]XP_043514692.1 uncharacterized protein LOC122531132 [Frieseomelitta varia]
MTMIKKKEILFVFGLFLILFCKQSSSECKQLTPCSCIFSNRQGYSLMPLVDSMPLKAFDAKLNYTFFFHPCTNKPLSDNRTSECYKGDGVSLCATKNNEFFFLGKAEDTEISLEMDNSKPPVLTFHHNNITIIIALACCSLCETRLYVEAIKSESEFHLVLSSLYACKVMMRTNSLSVGSTLLIYFSVAFGVYFIGGALTLKLLRGATGWEMMPNHEFWRNLPSLVKDGVVFTFNCCRLDSYERI